MESGQSRKLAVVTDASSGIGLELAKVFAEAPSAYEMFQKKEDGAIKGVLKP